MNKADRLYILGVGFDNVTLQELLREMKRGVLVTPNVDNIMMARRNPEFKRLLNEAEYSVCDSRIIQITSTWVGPAIVEAIPGSSLFPAFCKYHADNPDIKIFMLGGREGVPQEAMRRVNNRAGRRLAVGAYSPPMGFERSQTECDRIVELIKNSGANVVLVGLGNPKQLFWIDRNRSRLPEVNLFMALGATVDFEAGNIVRAPKWVQRMRIEWLFRFILEPRRLFRRYFIDDLPYFYHLHRERRKLNKKQ